MTSGYEANHSGQFLESIVEREFAARGFMIRNFRQDADNLDMFTPRILIKRVPYISVGEIHGHTEFVVADYPRRVRIECKWQNGPGSTDERMYYALENAMRAFVENETLILWGGNGFRSGIVDDIKRKAERFFERKIWVLNINEFPLWVKQQFVRPVVREMV